MTTRVQAVVTCDGYESFPNLEVDRCWRDHVTGHADPTEARTWLRTNGLSEWGFEVVDGIERDYCPPHVAFWRDLGPSANSTSHSAGPG